MGQVVKVPAFGSAAWKSPVEAIGDLPASGNALGDARVVTDNDAIYVWDGSAWQSASGGGSSFTTIQTDSGTSPAASGSSDTLTLTSDLVEVAGNSSTDTVSFAYKSEYNAGTTGATATINWNNAPAQRITLGASTTISFSNGIAGGVYILRIIQDGAGGAYAPTLNTTLWAGGTAPTITTADDAVDLISLYYDGTNYIGTAIQDVS